jgi:hypothetical protein
MHGRRSLVPPNTLKLSGCTREELAKMVVGDVVTEWAAGWLFVRQTTAAARQWYFSKTSHSTQSRVAE